MKKYLIVMFVFAMYNITTAQEGEFEVYKNGLIYSENTMSKLSHIVDSLNLKYKTCDFNKVFYASFQTVGNAIEVGSDNAKEARKDIQNNIGFDAFKLKYPNAKIKEKVLIVRYEYKDYKDNKVVSFNEVSLKNDYGELELSFKKNLKSVEVKNIKNWIYKFHDASEYYDESLSAFFLPQKFTSKALPAEYSRMIGYADCLIDTTTTKFKSKAKTGWVSMPKDWKSFSKKRQGKLLDKMRGTKVVGGCSMDDSPRIHAKNIALLSAETTNWEVFLKAHLDILNDNFERVSDGSYAWERRNTYIKELEELDINTENLIVGISLRIENSSKNHYYGSISRIGRAISEAKNKDVLESRLLSIIENNEIDDYNRVLTYYLFLNYLHYIDKSDKKSKTKKLKNSIQKLPRYLSSQISFKN